MQPAFHIITPVWGDAYTRCFVDACLPTLLSAGNLPALSGRPGSLYHLFTTEADRKTIEASSAYRRLQQTMPVKVDLITDDPAAIQNQYLVQSACYRRGIADADAADAAMIFLNADVVVADGGIRALATIADRGKRAIEVLGIRLIKNTIAPFLLQHCSSLDGAVITISPRELMTLAVYNLHPITRSHFYHGDGEGMWPAGLLWRVGSEGMVARCFHLHPILVHPRNKNAPFTTTIDDDYLRAACPDLDDGYVVVDSDEFCACEISEFDRRLTVQLLPRTQDNQVADIEIARWARSNTKPHHLDLIRHQIFLHHGPLESDAWLSAVAESDKVVEDVLDHLRQPESMELTSVSAANSASQLDSAEPLVTVLTTVRGKAATETFVRSALPSWISPGNLPALAGRARLRAIIVTDADGTDVMNGRRIMERLASVAELILCTEDPPEEMRRKMDGVGRAVISLSADLIISEGTLPALVDWLSDAEEVIAPAVPVSSESVTRDLRRYVSADGSYVVPGPALAELAAAHLDRRAVYSREATDQSIVVVLDGHFLIGRRAPARAGTDSGGREPDRIIADFNQLPVCRLVTDASAQVSVGPSSASSDSSDLSRIKVRLRATATRVAAPPPGGRRLPLLAKLIGRLRARDST